MEENKNKINEGVKGFMIALTAAVLFFAAVVFIDMLKENQK